VFQAAFKKYF